MAQKGQAPVRHGEEGALTTKRSGDFSRTLFLSNTPLVLQPEAKSANNLNKD